jgi:drug/metabolite transporter (DMT)-like permease
VEAAGGRREFLISKAKAWIHRVIAVLVVALAGLVLVAEWVRHHSPVETGVLLGLLAVVAVAASRLVRDLRLHPANFPAPTPSFGLKLPGRE